MSILGRRPSRDDSGHDGSQGRWRDDRDYGDDNWSPDEYFSPQDIRGTRAAPSRPEQDDRFGGPGPARFRGEADDFDGRGADRARGGDPADNGSFPRAARGSGRRGVRDGDFGRSGDFPTGSYDTGSYDTGSYDTGSYDTGSYDTGEFDTGGFRTGGYGRDQDDPNGQAGGERGGRKRRIRIKRRDKGDDIWPEDGVSDEDYWASVAADRPLPGTSSALDSESTQVMGATAIAGSAAASSLAARPADRPAGPRPGQQYQGGRPALDAAPAAGAPGLRPAPRPGISSGPLDLDSGPMSRGGTPSGPFPRPGATSGPMGRPGTGPHAARPAVGPAQPTFSPATPHRGEAQRPNWADTSDRTERFDRIAADSGVRSDRPAGSTGSRRDSRDADSRGGAPQRPSFEPHGADPQGQTGSWGRAEGPRGADPARGSSAPRGRDRMLDSGPQRNGPPRHRSDPPRGGDPMRSAEGARGALTGPQRARDDDPLTSPLFSREAMAADTRSYQGARRAQPAAGRPGGAQTGESISLTGSYPAGADPYAGQSASGWISYAGPGATSTRPADADPYARPGAPAGAGHGGSPLGSSGYATGSFANSTASYGTSGYGGAGYSSPGYGGADGYSSGGYGPPGYDPASYPATGREPGGYGSPAGGGLPTGSHGATGGYGTQASGPAGATPYPATGGYMTTGSYQVGGYPADGSPSGSHPAAGYRANGAGSTPAGSTAQAYGTPVYGAPPSPAAGLGAGNMPSADGYGYEARPGGYEDGSAFPGGTHQPPAR